MAAVRDCGYELVDHPTYFPDLAPSISCSPIKKKKKKNWLRSSIGFMSSYLQLRTFSEDQDESFYNTGIQALQNRWKKCADRKGDYVEKLTLI